MIAATAATGCQKKTTVTYGYQIICFNCQKILEGIVKAKSVLSSEARGWQVKKIRVPCAEDQICNAEERCGKCQFVECRSQKNFRIAGVEGVKNISNLPSPEKRKNKAVEAKTPSDQATPLPSLPEREIIRVAIYEADLLAQPASSISFFATGPYQIYEGGKYLAEGRSGQAATVSFGGGFYHFNSHFSKKTSSYLRFVPKGEAIFEINSIPQYNQFRGTLEVRFSPSSQKLWLVNELDMESYLRGIGEEPEQMPGMAPDKYGEFLKAAAVAFRSYVFAVKKEGKRNKSEPFDILATSADQIYLGYRRELQGNNLKGAVEATSGQIVTYQGQIAKTAYFGSCDGKTRPGSRPWLVSVSSPFCLGQILRGHGWGMCMHGARYLASNGYSYQQILSYYYPGTFLQTR